MRKDLVLLTVFWFIFQALPVSAATRGLGLTSITTAEGEEIALYQGSYALVIGNSDYTAGWPDLPGVKKDIVAIQAELESQGFQVEVVENLTRPQLDQAFTDFITQYGQSSDNRLLFYFSGHGHTLKLSYGDEMGYIVPVDAPNPNTEQASFIANALDMQMIEVYAKRIQSKHALFLFDSCFSGSIFSLSRAVPESISYKTAQPVRQFITSGSAEEQVPDESVFRQQFIAALQGEGDVNGDGYVTGAELGEFLQANVVNYSKGSQHPQYGKIRHATLDKGDFVFQLPGAVKQAGALAASTATAVTTSAVADPETEMWELVKSSETISDVKDFLAAYPDGKYAKVAELKLKQLEREQTVVASPAPQTEPAVQPPPSQQVVQQGSTTLPPLEPERENLPPQPVVDALSRIRDDLFRFREELAPLIKARDSIQFEERVNGLLKKLTEDIDAARKLLETSHQYEHLVPTLIALREKMPRKMEELRRLIQAKKWEILQEMHQQLTEEMVKTLEDRFPRLRDTPARTMPLRQPVERKRP